MAIFLSAFYFVLSSVLILLIVLISPLFLFRYIISLLCPLIRPDLEEIVSPRSAVHTIDDLHSNPKNSELVYGVVKGPVDVHGLRSQLKERIYKFDLNRFKQYFVKWVGYYFWKCDPDFDIKNHANYYISENGNIDDLCTEKQIHSQHNKLLLQPFPKNRSPWLMLVVKNYQPKDAVPGEQYSLLILLIHHSIADGYGLMTALMDIEDEDLPQEKKLTKQSRNYIWDKFSKLIFLLRAPYLFVKYFHDCMDTDSPFIMENRSGSYYTGFTKLDMTLIKKIQNKYGARFTSVYLAAISSGLRNFLLDHNLRIPPLIHVFFPLPIPGPFERLTNRVTFVLIKLPIGKADSVERLEFITRQFTQLKNSPFPTILGSIPLLAGSLPSFMIRPLITVKYTSAVTSNFPGPNKDIRFVNYRLTDWSVSGNLMGGHSGMAFANLSLKNSSTVTMIGDKSIFPNEESVEKILENMNAEIQFLSKE